MKQQCPTDTITRPAAPVDPPGDFPADVSIAVIAHDAIKTLAACMKGVADSGCPLDRVTVYDVASTDGSAAWLAEHAPGVRVVSLVENRGPNPARNLALVHSHTPFVVVMDADVQLLPGTVRALRTAIGRDETTAVATPIVLYADRPDTVQYHRTFVHYLAEASAETDDKPVADLGDETARVGLASGCAPLIRVSAARDVGMFEERYFFGKTDGEFAYRVTLGGWQIVEPASAHVLHYHHARGTRYYTHQVRNRWHFMLKNFQLRTLLAILPVLLIHEPALLVWLLIKGRAGDYVHALDSLLALMPMLSSDRREAAKSRRMHDWQVLRGDRLVIPGDFKKGWLGRLVVVYARALDGYWRVAQLALRLVSRPIRSVEFPPETLGVLNGGQPDALSDPSSHTHAA